MKHNVLISLGSNWEATLHVPRALEVLSRVLEVVHQSEQMSTTPVDFPYPSPPFKNVILECRTSMTEEELSGELLRLEQLSGRDRTTPHLIPLDADIIAWEDEIRKPQDLRRDYFKLPKSWLYYPIVVDAIQSRK